MINKKEKAKSLIIIGAVVLLFSICAIQLNENSIATVAEHSKTIGWGIKRAKNNMQPDVGDSNKKVLEENEVKATFFITSHYLNTASDLVERMINEGNIVGNQFHAMVMYYI